MPLQPTQGPIDPPYKTACAMKRGETEPVRSPVGTGAARVGTTGQPLTNAVAELTLNTHSVVEGAVTTTGSVTQAEPTIPELTVDNATVAKQTVPELPTDNATVTGSSEIAKVTVPESTTNCTTVAGPSEVARVTVPESTTNCTTVAGPSEVAKTTMPE